MKIVLKEAELKKSCEHVESVEEGLAISKLLFTTLENEQGIGLAANQIGINKRVCVISIPKKTGSEIAPTIIKHAFVNPIIIKKSNPFIFTKEGCLSYPGKWVETVRFHETIVRCDLNPEGLSLSGLEAVCAQHEIDHLNGITMYDRKLKNHGVNSPCPCDSGKKFKKCCLPILSQREIL